MFIIYFLFIVFCNKICYYICTEFKTYKRGYFMIITNTTNFRLKLRENLDLAEREEVIVTRNNNKNIVLLDLEKYKKLVAELEQLKASK